MSTETDAMDRIYETVETLPGANVKERCVYAFSVIIGMGIAFGVEPDRLTAILAGSIAQIKQRSQY